MNELFNEFSLFLEGGRTNLNAFYICNQDGERLAQKQLLLLTTSMLL